jgi:hypothetical protein
VGLSRVQRGGKSQRGLRGPWQTLNQRGKNDYTSLQRSGRGEIKQRRGQRQAFYDVWRKLSNVMQCNLILFFKEGCGDFHTSQVN